jgi:site-specific DNA-methyltransferase (adenine-specific)
MTNDNKQKKLSDRTDTAIAYSTCCVSGAVSKDGISLINGDCLQALRGYGDNHFKIAIVDPPYGINAGKMTMGSGKHKFSKDKDWDSAIPSEEYFTELFRVSENQIVWGGNYFTEFLPPTPHWLLWDKKNPNLSFAEGELAWVRKGKNLRIFQHYSAQVEEGGKIHPTQKPVKLYRWILNNYTSEGDLILDTHLGSGSIAIACHQMKRNLIAYEIDTEYYRKACKRFEEQTRQTALW